MAQLALGLLGPLYVMLDDQPVAGLAYAKVRALLAYLAVEARPHGRDALAELLWPGQPAAAARRSLRVALVTLRQALGDGAVPRPFLLATRESVQLNPASDCTLDVSAFADLLRANHSHTHPDGTLCPACAARLAEAMALYRGDFLQLLDVRDSLAFEEWVTLRRERLHRQALDTLEALASYHEAQGEDDQARQYAWRTLTLESWDEAAHRCIMRVLARKGQRSAALEQYTRCRKVLAEELGVEPAAETTALYEQIRTGAVGKALSSPPPVAPSSPPQEQQAVPDQASAPAGSAQPVPSNLPTPPTPLIGRADELASLGALLRRSDVRLVTLTGVGGSGKTRLALQMAVQLLDAFPDGVWFVDLAPLSDPTLVIPAIVQTLGLKEQSGQAPLAQLSAYLRQKQLLLLLDNFEQVVDAASQVAELLAVAPQLNVLITSRVVLHLRGEQEFQVPPLALPDRQRLPPFGLLAQYAAVALFVARVHDVQPGFELNSANAPAVAEICCRLDGLPLAIELAAARIKLFAPAVLLKRLEQRLTLLTGGPRDAPARQQTLRATIDWSYDLLNEAEQRLFRQLGVFSGGCTQEAVEHVCDLLGDQSADVLDRLTALLDKSLLQQAVGLDSEPRYTMLETIREYALEQLVASGEEAVLRRRHSRYYLETTIEVVEGPGIDRRYTAGDDLAAEIDNLRSAFGWALAQREAEIAQRLSVALLFVGFKYVHKREALAWLETALALSDVDDVPSSARATQARSHFVAGWAAWHMGDYDRAQAHFAARLALEQHLGDQSGIAHAQGDLGWAAMQRGELAEAQRRFEQRLAFFQETQDSGRIAYSLLGLGYLAFVQGKPAQAEALIEKSLTAFRVQGDMYGCQRALTYLGDAVRVQGQLGRAITCYRESFMVRRRAPNDSYSDPEAPYIIEGLAATAAAEGRAERAARLFGAAEIWRSLLGFPLPPTHRAIYERDVAIARIQLGEDAFAAAWAAGRALTPDQALAEALDHSDTPTTTAEPPQTQPTSAKPAIGSEYGDTPSTPRHNLPAQLTAFVGREAELAQLAGLLADPACRMLTITGAGGIGKTRLALQAAGAQLGAYAHGVYLIPLASISSAEFLVAAIADSLGFTFNGPLDPRDQLLGYLREKQLLLLLDNFEHLLEGGRLVVDILTNSPAVKLLITSRERLNLNGEWAYELKGLAVPEAQAAARLEEYSAVQLFLHSARRAQIDFSLSDAEKLAVIRLCRMVDGMPLGLELAASWVCVLSCEEIVEELARSLSFLTSSSRQVPERHRSMHAVFDHSWKLLSAEERQVFQRLSVFQGGFGRDAAEHVAGASLPILAGLLDKSLLRRRPDGRYEMHELLRQYAAERLGELPAEQEMAQDDHGRYYLEFLRQREPRLKSSRQQQAMAEIRAEVDNIRLACQQAIAQKWAREIGLATQSLWLFYDTQGWYHEAVALYNQAAEALASEQVTRNDRATPTTDFAQGYEIPEVQTRERGIALAQVLAQQGWFLLQLGLIGKARWLHYQSVVILRRFGAQLELADTFQTFSMVASVAGDYREAQSILEECLAIYSEQGAQWGIALCFLCLGNVASLLGNYGEAKQYLLQALVLCKEMGDPKVTALVLIYLGLVARRRGEHTEAKQWLQESLTLSRAIGDRWSTILSLNHLGALVYEGGAASWPEAKRLHEESLAISIDLGNRREVAISLNYLADVTCALQEYSEAQQHLLASLQIAIEGQMTPIALDALVGLVNLLDHQPATTAKPGLPQSKERAVEFLALVLIHPASGREAKDRAHNLLAELEANLPPPVVAFARERGQARSLDEVAAELLAETA